MLMDVILKRLDGINFACNSRVVFDKRIFTGRKTELALTRFERMEIFDNAFVVRHERERPCHLAHHHSLAPKDLRTVLGIHAGVINTMAAANHKSAETHFFDRFDKTAFLVPRGFKPAACAERLRDL